MYSTAGYGEITIEQLYFISKQNCVLLFWKKLFFWQIRNFTLGTTIQRKYIKTLQTTNKPYTLKQRKHFNIILPWSPSYSKWTISYKSSEWNFECNSHLSRACYLPCSPHSSFDHLNNIWYGIQIMKLLTMHTQISY